MTWSSQRPFMWAVETPRMMPSDVARTSAAMMGSSEVGRKCMMSPSTGRLVRSDHPVPGDEALHVEAVLHVEWAVEAEDLARLSDLSGSRV